MSSPLGLPGTLLASNLAPGEREVIRVQSGKGVWLTLEDGRVVLDAGSSSAAILGHCHPELTQAVERAAREVYVNDSIGYSARERAAEDLLQMAFADESWADKVALFVSSSEAADLGLLLAQILSGRELLVSRELSYHGGVGLSREVSAHPRWGAHLASLESGITPRPFPLAATRRLPVPTCGIGAVAQDHVCAEECLRDAAPILADAAAVIMDYSQGGVCPSSQYQDTLAELAREAGAKWIADETVTGFGRLGHSFAFARGSSRPDMVTLGKGITGGVAPGGALVLSREIAQTIGNRRWMTNSTYRGAPITVAAISAVQTVLEREDLVSRSATLGPTLGRDLHAIAERHRSVESISGEGLMWLVRLAGEPSHAEESWQGDGQSAPLTKLVQTAALDRGVFIGVLGGACVWLIPPLIMTAAQLADATEALDSALSVADQALEGATAGQSRLSKSAPRETDARFGGLSVEQSSH
jgi:4-aminobutyrate aminotransferase-like enzyme